MWLPRLTAICRHLDNPGSLLEFGTDILLVRPRKDIALSGAQKLTPQYLELLIDLQRGGGRLTFSSEVASIQNRVGAYVLMFDDERKIGRALFLWLLGEDGYKEYIAQVGAAAPQEQQALIDEVSDFDDVYLDEEFSSIQFPRTPQEWQVARDMVEKLPEEERRDAEKRGAAFWCFYFSSFLNTLSLMVHGARMTALVPQALAGDDESFLKAVQIDRMLLLHHPYFRERKMRAQDEGNIGFLSKLSYREYNPALRSKIQYPGLFMLFGILDSFLWLDDLKHSEILDICDAAGLDRYQNRIADVNYLTKRLLEYRRWQKSGSVSMH